MEDLAKPRQVETKTEAPLVSGVKTEPTTPVGEKINTDMYITYSLDHDVPFVADYYEIGNLYDYKDLSYKQEIDTIDEYLIREVKDKRLENTTEAVKARLAQLEKVAGIEKHIPTSQRVKMLAAYAEYMTKLSSINHSVVF